MELQLSSKIKINSIFPRELGKSSNLQQLPNSLLEIYNILNNLYEHQLLGVEDFKSFRNQLSKRTTQEVENYIDLIRTFLSFGQYLQKQVVMDIDKKYGFFLLEEKKKIGDSYQCVDKEFEIGDIVRLSNAIYSKINQITRKIISSYLEEYIEKHSISTLNDLIVFYEELSKPDNEFKLDLLEKVAQSFDENFAYFIKTPEFRDYFLEKRKNLFNIVNDEIKTKKVDLQKKREKQIQEYYSIKNDTLKQLMKEKEKSKRPYGFWN